MKVAVSGANGFIGSHVVAALVRADVEPVCWVRSAVRSERTPPRHPTVAIDILDPPAQVFDRLGRPDALIHLAWGGLPHYGSPHHVERELPAHEALLTRMVEDGLANLVVAGTCFEYGMQSGALSETLETSPANAYAIAKDSLRKSLVALRDRLPFALTWARLFYLYGDRQAASALLPQLQQALDAGAKTFAMSGGEQLRDYMSVEAAADDLVRLTLAHRDHGVVNVCSGKPIAVRALVERWLAEHGKTIELDLGRHQYSVHEPMAFWGDDAKLRACRDRRF